MLVEKTCCCTVAIAIKKYHLSQKCYIFEWTFLRLLRRGDYLRPIFCFRLRFFYCLPQSYSPSFHLCSSNGFCACSWQASLGDTSVCAQLLREGASIFSSEMVPTCIFFSLWVYSLHYQLSCKEVDWFRVSGQQRAWFCLRK